MVTLDMLPALVADLPGAVISPECTDGYVIVKGKPKGFTWLWRERIHPKKPKVPNPEVLVLPVRSLTEKEIILGSNPEKYFTEPHYDGYAAVLVRLAAIEPDELRDLLVEAWRIKAPKELVREFDDR